MIKSNTLKKISLLIVFIGTVTFSFAMKDFSNPKFYVDARVGLGSSSLTGDFPEEMKRFTSGKISLVGMYRIKNNIMLETGIGRSSFANAYKSTQKIAYLGRYFQVPLMVRSIVYKSLSVGVGATYHFLQSAKEVSRIKDGPDVDITDQLKPNFPSASFSLQLGDQGAYFGFIYDYGLENIRSDNTVWNATSLRFYLQMNISQLIKARMFDR